MRILFICFAVFLFISCTNDRLEEVEFLIGTWKIESENQYETWAKDGRNNLMGHSYEINENQKIVLESIAIRMVDKQMIYEATVPDQNEGQTIQFVLNPEVNPPLSFENLKHDFPKKILYHKISEKEVKISVLGDEGEGFSYIMLKQDNE